MHLLALSWYANRTVDTLKRLEAILANTGEAERFADVPQAAGDLAVGSAEMAAIRGCPERRFSPRR